MIPLSLCEHEDRQFLANGNGEPQNRVGHGAVPTFIEQGEVLGALYLALGQGALGLSHQFWS